MSPFPSALKPSLAPLVSFMRTLPLPPSHPSHPAAPGIQATLKESQKGYADMRGSWGKKCLENYGRRVVDRAESLDGVVAGREFGVFVENLLSVAEVSLPHVPLKSFTLLVTQTEYDLLTELAPLPGQANLSATYSTLLTPLIQLFSSTLSSLGSLIKRSLHKYTFLALSAYAHLSESQARWDDVMCRRSGRKENELKDGLHSIRASCLRCFPEFLADIKAASLSNRGELSTGLADFTLSVRYTFAEARLMS